MSQKTSFSEDSINNELKEITSNLAPFFKDVNQAKISEVNLTDINVQSTYRISIDPVVLDYLINSMKNEGLYNAILIDENKNLISGYLRYAAAKKLGWETIQAKTITGLSELDKLIIQLNENERKKDFTSYEKAILFSKVKELYVQQHPNTGKGRYMQECVKKEGRLVKKKKETTKENSEEINADGKNTKKQDISTNANGDQKTELTASAFISKLDGSDQRNAQKLIQIGEAIENKRVDRETVDKFKCGEIGINKMINRIKKQNLANNTQDKVQPTNNGVLKLHCGKCRTGLVRVCPCCNKNIVFCKKKNLSKKYEEEACNDYF